MRRSDGIAILGLAVATLGLFAPALLGDRAIFTWNMDRWHPWAATASPEDLARPGRLADCARQFYPMRALLDAAVDARRIPLWNPHMLAGTPFLANFQPGVFYPPNLMLAVSGMDILSQMNVFLAGHVFFGALGLWALLRAFGAGPWAAVLGALTFVWSGFNAARTGIPTMPATGAWLPWALLASRRWFARRDGVSFAGMALCLGLSGLAGFAQIFVFVAYGWMAFGLIEGGLRRPAAPRSAWIGWVAAGGLGLALVSVHLLPTREFMTQATNAANPPAMLSSGTIHPWAAGKFLVPDLLGHPADGSNVDWMLHTGDASYSQTEHSTASYVGILPLLLGVATLFAPGDRRRATLAGGICAIAGFALCLDSPVISLLPHMPGLGFSRPDRATYFLSFGFALLAGLGADRLAGDEGPGVSRTANRMALLLAALILAFALLLVLSGARLLPPDPARALGDAAVRHAAAAAAVTTALAATLFLARARGAIPGGIFLGLALALVVADLGSFASRMNVMQPRSSIYRPPAPGSSLEFLRAARADGPFRIYRFEPGRSQFRGVLPPAIAEVYGLDDVLLFDSLNLERGKEMLAAIDPETVVRRGNFRGTTHPEALRSPVLRLLGVRYVLAEPSVGPHDLPDLRLAHRSDLSVFELDDPLPRAFLVADVRVEPDPDRVPGILASPDFSPDLQAVSEVPLPGWPPSPGADAAATPGTAQLREYAEERVRVAIAPARTALLVLADAYYPGWKASVDGVERPIHRVDHLLRGVVVDPGDREVVFEYRPASFRLGAGISLAALGLVLAGAFALGRGRLAARPA